MDQYLLFALIGLGAGCIYATVGLGVVITYRGTGVINFGTGAMALWGVYVYDELRRNGDLLLPVAVVPHRVSFSDTDPGFWAAYVAGVLSCTIVGLAVHFLVFRPLRNAPALAKVVASVGVLLTLQALIVLQLSTQARIVPPIVPNEPVSLGDITFSRDRLWLTLAVVVVTVLVWLYFRYTRIGVATMAAAENERAAALAGYSPDILAGATWVLSSTLVGALLILISPLTPLTPSSLALAIVPALAAALIGRMQNVGITVAAGLALGSFSSVMTFVSSKSWWPDWAVSGLSDAVPFVVIVVTLFLVGDSLPTRDSLKPQPLPEVIRPNTSPVLVVPVVAVVAALLIALDGSYRFGLITTMIYVLIMLSLVILTGLVGQISLAQAGIAGSAGFALSRLASDWSIPFPVSTILAALVATLLGVVIGIPALRIRGAQLAVVTLAGAVALERFVFRNSSLASEGGNQIPDPSIFGWDLGIREGREIARLEFGLLVLVVVVLCALATANLARSATGRRFLAIRSNERAGAAVGVSIAQTKLLAFGLASFVAGLGGSFIGYSRGQLSAESFTVFIGLTFLAFAYLGGITSVYGAIVAAGFAPLGLGYVFFNRHFELGESYALLAGAGLIATAIFNPEGIVALQHKQFAWLRQRFGWAETVDEPPTGTPADQPAVPTGRTSDRRYTPDADVVLDVESLTVQYGGLVAVNDFSMEVRQGQIVGLIGPNGAGKTTSIDALTGFTKCTGSVRFLGEDITGQQPHVSARAGVVRTWQSLELFNDLTVEENCRVATEHAGVAEVARDLVRPTRSRNLESVDRAIALAGLDDVRHVRPNELPLGRQKLVGVARSLAGSPKILMLDEPAAGLDTDESVRFGGDIRQIANEGVGVLLVDHDMHLVLDVCDYIYVLDFGNLIAQRTPQQIQSNPRVIDAYLGTEVDA